MARRRTRTGWVALLASLALHLAVLFAISRHLPSLAPPPPRPPPLEVQVIHLPPEPTAPPAQRVPPAPPAPPSRRKERPRAGASAAPATARSPQRPDQTPAERPPADAPIAGGPGTLLLPGPGSLPPPPDDGVRVTGEEGGLHARGGEGDVAGTILRESAAQQNVARGNVHAYFGQLRDVLERIWDVRRVAREGRDKSRIGAQVRLTQGAGGELRAVELVFSSSDDDIDKGLIADLRAAAHALPAPPPEVVRGRTEFSSLWAFQFLARTPYRAKGAMATFDIVRLFDKRAIPPPLDKRVELLEAD